MGWFSSFIYSQLFVTLPKPTKDFTGQTIIISGSNTGLGLEAARHISRLDASLIVLAVRDVSKGAAAKQSILESTGRHPSSIQVWHLDLQSYDSVKAFAERANKLPRIDAVLENAGIMTKYFKVVEGFESTITINVISTILLALLLLPKLEESAEKFNIKPRISIVASDLHFVAKFPEGNADDIFDALNDETFADMSMERYGVSKLIEVFAVREIGSILTQRAKSTSAEVIINCMTPGACKSDFDRESTGVQRFIAGVMAAVIARSTEQGSRTLVAGVEAGDESHGKYMADCQVMDPSPMVLSPEGAKLQKKVWQQLLQRLNVIYPEIEKNIT